MRIGIDGRFLSPPLRGIGNYSKFLLQELLKQDDGNQYILFHWDSACWLPSSELGHVVSVVLESKNYWWSEQVELPRLAKSQQVDVLFCLGNTFPVFLHHSIRLVVTIHDVMFLLGGKTGSFLPKPKNLYQWMGKLYRSSNLRLGWRRIHQAITDSRHSESDISGFFPRLPVTTIHLGILPPSPVEKRAMVEGEQNLLDRAQEQVGKYFLVLGGVDQRKNTRRILEAAIAVKATQGCEVGILIVGVNGIESTHLAESFRLAQSVIPVVSVGFVSESGLRWLYSQALALLYPSLYEGFGFPILEAMALGCPVLTSNTTSCPEVAGEAALLVNPLDTAAIASSMFQLWNDVALRDRLREAGRGRTPQFTWAECARKTKELLIHGR